MDNFDRFMQVVAKLDAKVEVGAFDARSATLLGDAEFGTSKAPARPVLTAAFDRNQSAMETAMDKVLGRVLDLKGGSGSDSLVASGRALLDKVADAVQRGVSPGLAPATIASRRRRGNDDTTPLIDPSLLGPGDKTMISSLKVEILKGK